MSPHPHYWLFLAVFHLTEEDVEVTRQTPRSIVYAPPEKFEKGEIRCRDCERTPEEVEPGDTCTGERRWLDA